MSTSYDRNIERLKANQAFVSQSEQSFNTEEARLRGKAAHEQAALWGKLTPFSEELQAWKKRDIEKQKAEGIAAARKAKVEKSKLLTETAKRIQDIEEAKRVGELAFEFEDAEAMDMEYQRLKKKMLDSAGTSAYPDADRISQLSPWQQVGFAQEKLRIFNDSFEDKLAHAMQNSEELIEVAGIKFTPKEIRDKNLAFPMKQAAIDVLADKIRDSHQIDRFSPEMLRLSKTEDAIQKAKESQLVKYRERYNIESSMNTRQKANLEWQRSDKTAYNLEKLILMHSATVDKDGDLVGNAGAWKNIEKILIDDGIAQHNPEYAHQILDQPMTDNMCRELGVKKGTTFSQQWPKRTEEIKRQIKEGYVKEINDEEKFIEAAGTELENEFKLKARGGALSAQEVNEYKRKFGELGLPIPGDVKNYETLSDRDEREDKDTLEALVASNNGRITHEELDQFHPKAALEYREKADKFQREALKAFDAEKKIKAHLDTAFTNMGIKGNEKSPAYIEAMANAKADYAEKYNRYISMGYTPAEASHHALHAQQVKNPETGEMLVDSVGVLHEIRTNGEGSKYVISGQSVEKLIKPGHLRVARIASGKREMRDDPNIIFNGTIGGDYGQRQIDSVVGNIDKYGVKKGLTMDKGAIQYYKGLARGRDNNWMGLLDAQLKANGHAGLWPEGKPEIQIFMEGKDENGEEIVASEVEGLRRAISACSGFPSKSTLLYQRGCFQDGANWHKAMPTSVFDGEGQLMPWIHDYNPHTPTHLNILN
jgi:hypothetical protein